MGKRIRALGVANGESGESGLSTVIPVLFGDSGVAIMCAGSDWRFNESGVLVEDSKSGVPLDCVVDERDNKSVYRPVRSWFANGVFEELPFV